MSRSASRLIKILGTAALVCAALLPSASAFQVKQGKLTIVINFSLPEGYEFTQGAPFKMDLTTNRPDVIQFGKFPAKFDPTRSYRVPLKANPGKAIINLKATLYYCDKETRMCLQDTYPTSITVETAGTGASTIIYAWHITPPKQTIDNRLQTRATSKK